MIYFEEYYIIPADRVSYIRRTDSGRNDNFKWRLSVIVNEKELSVDYSSKTQRDAEFHCIEAQMESTTKEENELLHQVALLRRDLRELKAALRMQNGENT